MAKYNHKHTAMQKMNEKIAARIMPKRKVYPRGRVESLKLLTKKLRKSNRFLVWFNMSLVVLNIILLWRGM